MSARWAQVLISAALVSIIAFTFLFPHEMISPGKLMAGHRKLESDCFACHVPFRGATPDRCMGCHTVADIGLRTTTGAQLQMTSKRAAFHQSLAEKNCIACHSDHPPPALAHRRTISFAHALLNKERRAQCATCHQAPVDSMHREVQSSCAQCHNESAWKPASFVHERFFPLDANHNVTCTTCHFGRDYRRYTCFGCHAHEREEIIAEHQEEGIRNIDNCARCHNAKNWHGGNGEENGEGE